MKKAKKPNWLKFIVFVFILIGLVASDNLMAQELKSKQKENLKVIEFSIDEVSHLALTNSLDIQIAKFDAYIARSSLKKAESIFDTFLTAELSYLRDKKEKSSTIAGSETKDYGLSLELEKKLPTGTTLTLETETSKIKTDSSFSSLNPYHEALVGVSVTQELGKNFFGLADRSSIKITKLDIENSIFTSLDDIEDTLAKIQKSYWNFVFKSKELTIAKDMLKQAQKLYAIYKDKYSLGLVENSELLAVEALMKIRRSDVNIGILSKNTAKNDLLFLINQGDFSQNIRATDSLNCDLFKVDIYKALTNAVTDRRDYQRIKNDLKKSDIDIVVKKNALWPQIDLEATVARNNLDSKRQGAWSNLTNKDNDEVSLKLTISMPLEKREEKAELERVNLEKKRALLKLKRVERLILQQINNKVNEVNTAQNQVKLFEATVRIHQKKLKEQIKRLNYGRSNVDTLIQYEEDLLKARRSLAEFLLDYRKGLIELELVQNSLLDKYWKDEL